MTKGFIVSGTDTGIGKTVISAMLTLGCDGCYWKPLQSGTADGTDRERVKTLTGLPDERLLPEAYILSQPLSPHRAAELDQTEVDVKKLVLPYTDRMLIVEGAGGLLVPLTRQTLQIEIFKSWKLPLILCARTGLGTINHTLLSLEALRQRGIPLHGLIFIGPDNPDNIRTIAEYSGARVLGHMPPLDMLDRAALECAFAQYFRKADFA